MQNADADKIKRYKFTKFDLRTLTTSTYGQVAGSMAG